MAAHGLRAHKRANFAVTFLSHHHTWPSGHHRGFKTIGNSRPLIIRGTCKRLAGRSSSCESGRYLAKFETPDFRPSGPLPRRSPPGSGHASPWLYRGKHVPKRNMISGAVLTTSERTGRCSTSSICSRTGTNPTSGISFFSRSPITDAYAPSGQDPGQLRRSFVSALSGGQTTRRRPPCHWTTTTWRPT